MVSVRPGFVLTILLLSSTLWSQTPTEHGELTGDNKRVVCGGVENRLCLDFFDEVELAVLGCATGGPNPLETPPFLINVPPGEDFEFSIVKNPAATTSHFGIISEAAFIQRLDICAGMQPGVFTAPFPIDPANAPAIQVHTIPSAVVDLLKEQSDQDGFVILIDKECGTSGEGFVGVQFTREPVAQPSFNLTVISTPTDASVGEDFIHEIQFELTNVSETTISDLSFFLDFNMTAAKFIDATVNGSSCPDPPPGQCPFSLMPGETAEIIYFVSFKTPGTHPFTGKVLSDRCNDLVEAPVEVPVSGRSASYYGVSPAYYGGDASSTIRLYNPTNQPVSATVSATDINGLIASEAFDNQGVQELTLGARTSQELQTAMGDERKDGLFHITASAHLINQTRQEISSPGTLLGDSKMVQDFDQLAQSSGKGIVAVRIENPDEKLVLANFSNTEEPFILRLRDATTGMEVFTVTDTLDPLEVRSVPVIGTGIVVELDAGVGVILTLVTCDEDEFQVTQMTERADASDFFHDTEDGSGNGLGQPFFQPDPDDVRYGLSTLEMFVFGLTDQAVTAGSVDVSFDQNCAPGPENIYSQLFPEGIPNTPVVVGLTPQDQMVGGFAFSDTSDTTSSVRWQEGQRTYWLRSLPPTTGGLVFIPRTTPMGDPNPQIADIKFQTYSDAPAVLAAGLFDMQGQLIEQVTLSLPVGGHLLCNADFGLSNQVAFMEFLIPENHPEPFWFSPLAEVPELLYRDQLPIMGVQGNLTLANIGSAFASWSGGPSGCLGESPNVVDLTMFVNNSFQCTNP